jgi:hypothetical protein
VAAHNRAMLPVFGGISGSTRATFITLLLEVSDYREDEKERRASLEVLVVPF